MRELKIHRFIVKNCFQDSVNDESLNYDEMIRMLIGFNMRLTSSGIMVLSE